MESLFNSLERSIILEGLEVLFNGEDLKKWAEYYSHKEEVLVPGEIEFVERFREYVSLHGLPKCVFNPRYNLGVVDKVYADLAVFEKLKREANGGT